MRLSDFDNRLMTTKIIFDENRICPGDIISLYKIDATATTESDARFIRNAIVQEVTTSLIKYNFYDTSNEEITTGFLYSSEILVQPVTESQWEDKEGLFIFSIVREAIIT